jgi:hypothetical protein
VGRADDRVDLVRAAEADDRAVDGRVAQRPGDGNGARLGGRVWSALVSKRTVLQKTQI